MQRTAWLLTGDWGLAEDLVQTALARTWPRWERITRHGARMPGGLRFILQDLSFADSGRRLAVFGWGRCLKTAAPGSCKSPGQEMVVVNHASRGGRLASGRVIFTLPKLTSNRQAWINDAYIRPDGSTAIAVVSSSTTSVVQVSAATGRPSGVLYQVQSNLFIRPDPSGQFVLVEGHTLAGQIFGWIHHGKWSRSSPRPEQRLPRGLVTH